MGVGGNRRWGLREVKTEAHITHQAIQSLGMQNKEPWSEWVGEIMPITYDSCTKRVVPGEEWSLEEFHNGARAARVSENSPANYSKAIPSSSLQVGNRTTQNALANYLG